MKGSARFQETAIHERVGETRCAAPLTMPHNANVSPERGRQTKHQRRIPLLFGHESRTRILVALAEGGPTFAREMARTIDCDAGHVSKLSCDLIATETIARESGRYSRLSLNEDFFAFAELAMLLNALAGHRVLLIKEPRVMPAPPAQTLLPLFGTPNRTKILVALVGVGSANIGQLAAVAGVSVRSACAAVEHFEREGILRHERVCNERITDFHPGWPYRDLLLALLRRIAEAFPRIARAAEYQRTSTAADVQEKRLGKSQGWVPGLVPLGEAAQATVLYELGRCGPMTSAGLAKAGSISESSANKAIHSLAAYGLVVKKQHGSGHTHKLWAALNPRHPITKALQDYARDVARSYPSQPSFRIPPAGFPDDEQPKPIIRQLPGPTRRIGTLMTVFSQPPIAVSQIARAIGEREHKHVRRWLEDLHGLGMIDYGYHGARLIAMPNERYHSASLLKELVLAIARFLKP